MFWGSDRLHFVEFYLGNENASLPSLFIDINGIFKVIFF